MKTPPSYAAISKHEHIIKKKIKKTHKIIFTATGGKSDNVFKWAEQVISRHC